MKKLLLFAIAISFAFTTKAQSYSIKGSLIDSEKNTLPFTSVFLLTPGDSALVTFVRSDDAGKFEFKNVKKANYLVKATFVGYFPYQELHKYNPDVPVLDLGVIELKPIQKELLEVVIRTAKAPISIKGDTVEYDASKFKVPPGSSVEELLRKLPGFQVDAEGNMKAQGETVKKVTVDGKRFFGDDPKLATKNLPAEAINKVQVFNDKTDQSKLTGVDDGKHEKTVNLELKEEFKKGGFGKGTVGAGSDSRVMAKGNYNKFDSKNQFAVVGFGNNINQTGLSNNDYQDFKGSQSYNWNDNADFGFSQGGMRFIYFGDDEEEGLEIPQSWRPGQGLSKNYAGGMNYNYDTKKTKVSSNYFFNQSSQSMNQATNSQYFLPNGQSYFTKDSSFNSNYSQNHRVSFRFEKMVDSLNTLILNVNSKIGNRSQNSTSLTDFTNIGDEKFRNQDKLNNYSANNFILQSALVYRHKFMKKGRNFAWSGSYNKNSNDQESVQKNNINQFTVVGDNFSIGNRNLNLNQNVLAPSSSYELKSSLLFIEPLNKKFFLETFYNFSDLNQTVDRDVYDLFSDNKPRVDSLSRYFENQIIYNRIGSALRYSNKGYNLAIGAAAQQFNIDGNFYNNQKGALIGNISNTYQSLLPNVSVNIDLKNNKYLYSSFEIGVAAPKIRDLTPFTDNSNPLFIRNGNPDLLPTTSRSGNVGFSLFNPVSFINVFANLNYASYKNQVVYNQQIDASLVTTLTPENISGGNNYGYYLSFGFPIKKTKVSANLDSYSNFGKNLIYINNNLNDNKSQNYHFGFRLDLTPIDWFSLFLSGGSGINFSEYSIASTQNQRFTQNDLRANMTIQMPKSIYFTTDFNYTSYQNKKLGFNQQLPILNMSTYKILGKAKKSEIRFSIYDVFKKNAGIRQSAFQNVITSSVTQTLTRYFMVTYTYNMRGVSAKVKKSRWE
ncbi:TonB-dependent receptor [Lacihabitans sp. LS3-19]|uniref:TonB-dependent receptor n=1 Tax=Lacihabitans sp. LS3-19 TaxID=2487335 RepID=UPI0020CC27CF|nr:TonB-dependent receptor [Lacihabitans sp. LS3-19]MCP9769651.1 TonB-dependent receptor [Lacihabitans sp. LS3-19]